MPNTRWYSTQNKLTTALFPKTAALTHKQAFTMYHLIIEKVDHNKSEGHFRQRQYHEKTSNYIMRWFFPGCSVSCQTEHYMTDRHMIQHQQPTIPTTQSILSTTTVMATTFNKACRTLNELRWPKAGKDNDVTLIYELVEQRGSKDTEGSMLAIFITTLAGNTRCPNASNTWSQFSRCDRS